MAPKLLPSAWVVIFIMDMEKFVNKKDGGRGFNGCTFDQVWLIPQVYKTNKDYLEVMTGTKATKYRMCGAHSFLTDKWLTCKTV